MDNLRHLLPSINSLVVFEAAGRLESFSAAARDLGMTQAAVSYAVARLEAQLGTALFVREHRRVRLTGAGARFHADVSLGLSHIQRSAEGLRAASGGGHVTLCCSTAFAAFWMVPRMQQLRLDLPEIDLRIQTADRDLDLLAEGIPLGIRGGQPGDWPHYDSAMLAREEIFPVCAPHLLDHAEIPRQPRDLLTYRLIHLEEPFRAAATWADWFASAGVQVRAVPKGLQINDYVSVVQSVLEGQGVALGWRHLVEGMVARGVLVRLGDHLLQTPDSFHVVWPRGAQLSRAAALVRDWLIAQRDAQG